MSKAQINAKMTLDTKDAKAAVGGFKKELDNLSKNGLDLKAILPKGLSDMLGGGGGNIGKLVGGGASAAAATTAAIGALTMGIKDLKDSFDRGMAIKITKEQAMVPLTAAMRGDQVKVKQITEYVDQMSVQYPHLETVGMLDVAAGLAPNMGGNVEEIKKGIKLSALLQSKNPGAGAQVARATLSDASVGQYTRLVRSFDVPQSQISDAIRKGHKGMDVIGYILEQQGFNDSLLEAMSDTIYAKKKRLENIEELAHLDPIEKNEESIKKSLDKEAQTATKKRFRKRASRNAWARIWPEVKANTNAAIEDMLNMTNNLGTVIGAGGGAIVGSGGNTESFHRGFVDGMEKSDLVKGHKMVGMMEGGEYVTDSYFNKTPNRHPNYIDNSWPDKLGPSQWDRKILQDYAYRQQQKGANTAGKSVNELRVLLESNNARPAMMEHN